MINILTFEEFIKEDFKHKNMQKSIRIPVKNINKISKDSILTQSCPSLLCTDTRYKPMT